MKVIAALAPGDEVLVVGGTGLIGRALGGVLAAAGLRALHVARHDPPPGMLAPGARFVRADRDELPALIATRALAADRARPLGVVDVLAAGPDDVDPLLAALAGRTGRFIAIGSAAVFGQAVPDHRYAESTAPEPSTDPMRRKVALERLLADAHARGRDATVLRIAYPYGPGHGPLTPLGRARDLFTRLDGDGPLDWVAPREFAPLQPLWTEDLARVIAALLTRSDRPRPLYHVAGPEVVDWATYLRRLARGRSLEGRLRSHDAAQLQALNPAAWWIANHLRRSPLLDDTLVRAEVAACDTTLAQAVPAWAAWCASGAP